MDMSRGAFYPPSKRNLTNVDRQDNLFKEAELVTRSLSFAGCWHSLHEADSVCAFMKRHVSIVTHCISVVCLRVQCELSSRKGKGDFTRISAAFV